MSPALRTHFSEYASYHATPGNRACHLLGIPLIVLSLFGLLVHVPLLALGGLTLTLAELLLLLATLYYLTLDRALAAFMLLASLGLLLLGHRLSWEVALGLFVLGWVLQFVGHYVYEKKAPAFFGSLTHLLVGPLWILAKAVGRA